MFLSVSLSISLSLVSAGNRHDRTEHFGAPFDRHAHLLDPQPLSYGGVQPLHRKSQLAARNQLEGHVVQIWSRYPLELRGGEALVLHRVGPCNLHGLRSGS